MHLDKAHALRELAAEYVADTQTVVTPELNMIIVQSRRFRFKFRLVDHCRMLADHTSYCLLKCIIEEGCSGSELRHKYVFTDCG
jgi:hypothetical protein